MNHINLKQSEINELINHSKRILTKITFKNRQKYDKFDEVEGNTGIKSIKSSC